MNKQFLLLGIAALVFAGIAVVPQMALAYKGDANVKGPNYTEERHEAMETAIASKDANAVKQLMQGRGVANRLGEDTAKWNRFVEMQALQHAGKTEEAKQIRTELGLGLRNGTGNGQGMGNGRINQ